ncbi:MAG: lyase family protein [Verrucomicrobia bacterium]|nr:lyase family protein [Verrucomicrobiota bacterium]
MGALHLGRSRNDLNATMQRLELRGTAALIGLAEIRLMAALIERAKHEAHILLPAFTHFQPAVPILASQLWLSWATALERDARLLLDAVEEIDVLPLGAGAVAGTSVPLKRHLAVKLLGFATVAENSIDAVASRTYLLKLLGASAILGVDVSRFATDLLFLITRAEPIMTLPEEFLGSSSQMPQKANPFLLELVQARSITALHAFAGTASKMHGTPYTNSFAVSSEARWGARPALEQVLDALTVMEWVVPALTIDEAAALNTCERGFTTATAIAEEIASKTGIPFRQAHRLVGSFIRRCDSHPAWFSSLTHEWAASHGIRLSRAALDPRKVASRCNFGGGTGSDSVRKQIDFLEHRLAAVTATLETNRLRYESAQRLLDEEVRQTTKNII